MLPLRADAPVVVIGGGGVGLTAVATLIGRGHRAICAVDLSDAHLAAARELGASTTVSARTNDLSGKVMAATGSPVDAVIDFVNNDQTTSAAFDMLNKGGRMVQVGLFGGEATISTALLTLKMLTIEGSYVDTLAELNEVVALAKRGTAPPHPCHRRRAEPCRRHGRPGPTGRRWGHGPNRPERSRPVTKHATVDPTTGSLVREFDTMTDAEVNSCLEAAHAAYGTWRRTRLSDSVELLQRIADLHRERSDGLAELTPLEIGRPISQAKGEVRPPGGRHGPRPRTTLGLTLEGLACAASARGRSRCGRRSRAPFKR